MKVAMRILDLFEEVLIATLIAAATVIIFIAVCHRYLASLPIPYLQDALLQIHLSWAQEVCIYLFVWMAKFGAAYGVRTGIHVGVDVLINSLRDSLRKKFIIFGLLAGAFFTGVIAIFGGRFVWSLAQTNQTSPDLEIPIWIVYLAIPLGSGLMCFRFLQVAYNFIQTGKLPHVDESKVEGIELPLEEAPDLHPKDLKDTEKK